MSTNITNIEAALQALIAKGATLTLPQLVVVGLADASFLKERTLWYCEMWPESEFAQHWVEIKDARLLHDGAMIEFNFATGGSAVIAEMDPDERDEWQWEKWKQADRPKAFVESLKVAALNTEN